VPLGDALPTNWVESERREMRCSHTDGAGAAHEGWVRNDPVVGRK